MSWKPCLEPVSPATPEECGAIERVIVPRPRDIGAFKVRRVLPSARRQMIGPFIFFDQMGPAEFADGQGVDVRPHPHIGLATVTYLFEGALYHRDSLGTEMEILPGAVNWMIAGRGITHSERTAPERRRAGERLYGIQTWVALPDAFEETEPGFEHVEKERLPFIDGEGKAVRVILGSLYGEQAPVKTFSEMFYADAALEADARLALPREHQERGVYIAEGEIEIAGECHEAGRMIVFRSGVDVTLTALQRSRLMLLGGERLGGRRYIWWNFVATSREKMEAAKQAWAAGDWEHGRFRLPPSDDQEYIPLPDD